jgi:hypothetical protein
LFFYFPLRIAVPLVLDNERDPFAGSSNNSQVNTGSSSNGSASGSSPSSSGTSPTTPDFPPTFAPVHPPVSVSGSASSASSPTVSSDTVRLEQTLDYLVSSGVVTIDDLDRATSPQAEAAVWIATKDEFKMDIPPITTASGENHSRFIERWSLAVFYYSTSGPIWRYNLKFMEPIDHCDWYETFIDTTGSIVRMGVTTCGRLGTGFGEQRSEDQMVKRIELCKFLFLFF